MTNKAKASVTKHYALTFGENGNGTLRLQVRDRDNPEGKVYLDITVGGPHVEETKE